MNLQASQPLTVYRVPCRYMKHLNSNIRSAAGENKPECPNTLLRFTLEGMLANLVYTLFIHFIYSHNGLLHFSEWTPPRAAGQRPARGPSTAPRRQTAAAVPGGFLLPG